MVSKLFAHSSKALFRVFREDGGALWLREGQTEADYLDCQFVENWEDISVDGIKMSDATAKATFQVADVLAIDPARAGQLFRNEGRDKLTIGGRAYIIESCKKDSHGWIDVMLIGPIDGGS
ncbi:hypothetical protein [Neorhizobium galegae]|uniref:Phage head-tail adaptor n=1 Tax=Neorhizobium galegae bv. orientalis str. HAMBI 540 TaxID=1028800 RepID=A0A068SKV0_NEOGA|nr:hypothetical protein [Neorhizobium galegae]CDN46832.1 Hypothetical protein RG540_CH06420 [Neorhizobium galegae bv. orientalis str. HAMBI 540]